MLRSPFLGLKASLYQPGRPKGRPRLGRRLLKSRRPKAPPLKGLAHPPPLGGGENKDPKSKTKTPQKKLPKAKTYARTFFLSHQRKNQRGWCFSWYKRHMKAKHRHNPRRRLAVFIAFLFVDKICLNVDFICIFEDKFVTL